MRKQRQYTEDQKAEALAVYQSCGNVSETARTCGIPIPTIHTWVTGASKINSGVVEKLEGKKEGLAEAFLAVAWAGVKLAPAKAQDATYSQLMIGAGTAVDKALLLMGEATVITSNIPASVEERDQRALELLEKAKLRMEKVA